MASAAEWMNYAGDLLWQQALEWDNPTSNNSGKNTAHVWDWGAPTGAMYGGEPGMHMDRWMYWRAAFRTIIQRCSKLEEAELVVYYAQVSMAAMDRAMGVVESDSVGGDEPDESTDEVAVYLDSEDDIAEDIAGIRLGHSSASEDDAVGDVVEGFDGITLEPTVYKEEAVSGGTTRGEEADAKTRAVAKGKQVIKSEAFL